MAKRDDKAQYIKISELKPYENNARTHSIEQIEAICNSIKEFGFINPVIIDENNMILVGHGRIEAAKVLGIDEAPYRRVTNLTEDQKRAYILADNKLSDLGGWDEELLAQELGEIKLDMSLFGFDNIEISNIDINEDIDEDEIPEIDEEEEPQAKRGEIYKLGRHYLMCGDSTNESNVKELLSYGGGSIDMVFTDPPYNIAYQGVKDKRSITNDKMSDEDFISFLASALIDSDTYYVCCSWQNCELFKEAMNKKGIPPKAMIIWDKIIPAQNLDKYYKQYEIIFYYGKFGGEKTLRGDVWQCKRQKNTIHPTMKPIELIEMALDDNPDKKKVFDGFGRSGSTLIACEKTGRDCFMIEYEPHYIDVIIQRWENFTGKKAELVKEA